MDFYIEAYEIDPGPGGVYWEIYQAPRDPGSDHQCIAWLKDPRVLLNIPAEVRIFSLEDWYENEQGGYRQQRMAFRRKRVA